MKTQLYLKTVKDSVKEALYIVTNMQLKRKVITEKEYIKYLEQLEDLLKKIQIGDV